jgi:hypothetical protein
LTLLSPTLLLAAAILMAVALRRPSSNFAVLSGGCVALAAWTRPGALALAPLLLTPLFDRRYPARMRVHLAGSAVLGLGVGLLPWALGRA